MAHDELVMGLDLAEARGVVLKRVQAKFDEDLALLLTEGMKATGNAAAKATVAFKDLAQYIADHQREHQSVDLKVQILLKMGSPKMLPNGAYDPYGGIHQTIDGTRMHAACWVVQLIEKHPDREATVVLERIFGTPEKIMPDLEAALETYLLARLK